MTRAATMEILLLLIPVSVALVLLVGGVFWWSVKSGQFDDLDGPAHRILADDDAGRTGSAASPECDNPADAPDALTSINAARNERR